jgi:hypothetical protein
VTRPLRLVHLVRVRVVAGPGLGEVEPVTPCSQSQIGRDRHLRKYEGAQVEGAWVLSVVVRWGPIMTAVTGTLVARPARMTLANPGAAGSP